MGKCGVSGASSNSRTSRSGSGYGSGAISTPFDGAEDRGVGANRQRQGQDRGRGEAGRPAQQPDGVAQIVAEWSGRSRAWCLDGLERHPRLRNPAACRTTGICGEMASRAYEPQTCDSCHRGDRHRRHRLRRHAIEGRPARRRTGGARYPQAGVRKRLRPGARRSRSTRQHREASPASARPQRVFHGLDRQSDRRTGARPKRTSGNPARSPGTRRSPTRSRTSGRRKDTCCGSS